MKDIGRSETDKKLEELQKEISGIYEQANREMLEKMRKYLKRFKKKDEQMRQKLENGEITADEYKEWRMHQMFTTNRWKSMCGVLAQDMNNSNNIARSVIQGYMPEVYAINHNWTAYDIENKTRLNTNFALYNADVVERLLKDDPDIMPLASEGVNSVKDIAWNRKVINAVMLQGILQGESIEKMAKRFEEVGVKNHNSAVRYSRTAITGAENAGRIDGYRRAQSLGISVKKVWLATLDKRTRDSHRHMDGEEAEVEEEFSNGCMHPGDPNCEDASEVWNCRCTLITKVNGDKYDVSKVERNSKLGDMSYEDWKQGKDHIKPKEAAEEKKKAEENKKKVEEDAKEKRLESIRRLMKALKEDSENRGGNYQLAIDLGRAVLENPDLPYAQMYESIADKVKEYREVAALKEEYWNQLKGMSRLDVERRKVSYTYQIYRNRYYELKEEIVKAKKQVLVDTIFSVRKDERGGIFVFDDESNKSKNKEAARALSVAASVYPKSWIDELKIYLCSPLSARYDGRRSYNAGRTIYISHNGEDADNSAIHEVGHSFERALKGMLQQERAFYEYRTKGEKAVKMSQFGSGYSKLEKTKLDNFEDYYMGKDYGGTDFELISMGFEWVLGSENECFIADEEMERWIVGLLCGF